MDFWGVFGGSRAFLCIFWVLGFWKYLKMHENCVVDYGTEKGREAVVEYVKLTASNVEWLNLKLKLKSFVPKSQNCATTCSGSSSQSTPPLGDLDGILPEQVDPARGR